MYNTVVPKDLYSKIMVISQRSKNQENIITTFTDVSKVFSAPEGIFSGPTGWRSGLAAWTAFRPTQHVVTGGGSLGVGEAAGATLRVTSG